MGLEFHDCCGTTKGGPHRRGCPQELTRTTRLPWQTQWGAADGVDAVLPSDRPGFVVLLNCAVRAVTAKAVLIDHERIEVWVPLSLTTNTELVRGKVVDLEVADWFAEKNNLI